MARLEQEPVTSTLTAHEPLAGSPTARLEVEVLDGPDLGVRLQFDKPLVSMGSHEDADLRLRDPTVSRRHAELRALASGVLLVDLESKNGTRVSGIRVKEALLTDDGSFELGNSRLRVTMLGGGFELPTGHTYAFGAYLTASEALAKALEQLRRGAQSEATVLIEGETGTGKELLARGVHDEGPRKAAPFVVVDCGAVTASLLESQLFGHTKGAFTGAVSDQAGAFEAAKGGTIFLDELGELPLDLQPKLLRVLESRTVRRLGEVSDRPVDVRIVAATNRDLEVMVAEGRFRRDLYYRVAVLKVSVPPLRARPEDVPLLAAHYAAQLGDGKKRLAPETFAALAPYDWPGNARELRNVIHRAVALSAGPELRPEDLFPSEPGAATFHEAKDRIVAAFEQRYAKALFERHDGNVSRAAREAGLSRNALYALVKRAGLDAD